MPRTNSNDVKAVLRDDYDTVGPSANPDLTPFIAAASAVVNQVVILASQSFSTFRSAFAQDVATQQLVECWLAAHFYQASDKGYASRSTEGASGSFQGQKGSDSLDSTEYGRRAKLLDYSGYLTVIDKRQFAGGFAVTARGPVGG